MKNHTNQRPENIKMSTPINQNSTKKKLKKECRPDLGILPAKPKQGMPIACRPMGYLQWRNPYKKRRTKVGSANYQM